MISNKDYEKLWQRYQKEGVAKNMTLQMFCSMNNVPYNSFEKYLVTRRGMSEIYKVEITDTPNESTNTSDDRDVTGQTKTETEETCSPAVRILVTIKTTNGLSLSQGNLSYQGLKKLVEKLEAIC